MLLASFRWGWNFINMDSWALLSSFFFNKTENVWSVSLVMDKSCSKSTSMTFEQLLFSSFNKIKLNVSIDSFSSIWSRNSKKGWPFSIRGMYIADNSSLIFELSTSIKNFHFLIIKVINTNMINWSGSDNS